MYSVNRYRPADERAFGLRIPESIDDLFDVLGAMPSLPVVSRAALRFRVVEHPDHYDVSVEAPGARKEDMKLRVEEDVLIVEYAPKENSEGSKESKAAEGKVVLDEHSSIRSRRALRFGSELAQSGHEASMENGVLRIRLLKKAPVPRNESRELVIR